ncbi:MAG: hypothetical protein ACFFAN_00130 [Promethearchaeota archaeon]
MVEFSKYRGPILTIVIIIVVLMVMLAIGFTIGILSEDPDGLERAVSDAKGEEWLESLSSPWQPILGGIENDYIAGIIGVLLSVVLMIAVFTLLLYAKKRKQ